MIERAMALYEPLQRVNTIEVEEFEMKYALPQIPLVIEGMSEGWPARKSWKLKALKQQFGHQLVKLTSSYDESDRHMTLKEYISYMDNTHEDHAYYLKNWVFADDFPAMKQDYKVLPHFSNWLDILPADINPKFSWLFIGPAKSYSQLHLDIFLTNAWNILIEGAKLWLFFPPDGNLVFHELKYDPLFPGYRFPANPELKGYYAVQKPGEIMFTPGNWYHQVYNLENTVALTENYINHTNYKVVENYLSETENFEVLNLLSRLRKTFI